MRHYLVFASMIAICCSSALAHTQIAESLAPNTAKPVESDPSGLVCEITGYFKVCSPDPDEQEITVTAMTDAERYDPARVICEIIPLTGSRLAKMRVCMRSFQWDEARQADRELMDRLVRSK